MTTGDKWAVARALDEISQLIELGEPNPFRARAFARAARAVEGTTEDLDSIIRRGELTSLAGVGKAIGPIIEELVATGTSSYLNELRANYPPGIFELLRVPNLGLKKVAVLYGTLGIGDLEGLEQAARDGRLATVRGFGAKTAEKILAGISRARTRESLFLLPKGLAVAGSIREQLEAIDSIDNVEVTGSVRRRLEIVGRVDIAIATRDMRKTAEQIRTRSIVDDYEQLGDTLIGGSARDGIPVRLHLCEPHDFGAAVLLSTGSDEFLEALRVRMEKKGFELRDSSLRAKGRAVRCSDEREIFDKVGVAFIEPERREDGEDLTSRKRVPLVEASQIRGSFHVHTTYSDGRNSLADMLAAARNNGDEYVGISDHSQNAFYARGLTPGDVERQHQDIDAALESVHPLRVFRGTEADILDNGGIDYGHEVLQRFDFVIASVHSRFGMDIDQMTERMLRAIDDPFVTFLGHLTGRKLLARDGYRVHFDRIFERAAERGVMIEINGNPNRLDLDWRLVRKAVDAGVMLSIHPDAHSIREMSHVISGTWVARKGGLPASAIFNTRPADEVAEFLKRRRDAAITATIGPKRRGPARGRPGRV